MYTRSFFITLIYLLTVVSASPSRKKTLRKLSRAPSKLTRRDFAPVDSPSGGYQPVHVTCPSNLAIRSVPVSGKLSTEEAEYLAKHAATTAPAWKSYLENVALKDFDVEAFLATGEVPVTAAAASGGGYRSMLFSAGILAGLDARSEPAVEAKTGGVLNLLTYLSGQSSGAWLVGSWALADTPTFPSLNSSVWDLSNPLGDTSMSHRAAFEDAASAAYHKWESGYPVSLVDLWGRLLSYHLISAPTGPHTRPGLATLWSGIRATQAYLKGALPFPLIELAGEGPNEEELSLESPTYELSPVEFGLRHPSLSAFVPVDYLGTHFENGSIFADDKCTRGFDNAGFLLGAGSDLFLEITEDVDDNPLIKLLDHHKLADIFPDTQSSKLLSARVPSPFKGLGTDEYTSKHENELLLTTAENTHENIPFQPLIVPERKVDVILAMDGSADTPEMRPNGSSVYETYLRTHLPGGYDFVSFPEVPMPGDEAYDRISWFGCSSDTTIVYVPNIAAANDATAAPRTQLSYSGNEVDAFFENSFSVITQPDSHGEWPVCLACVLVDKQLHRNGEQRTEQCQQCFDNYCHGEDGHDFVAEAAKAGPSQHHHHHHRPSPGPSQKYQKLKRTGPPQIPLPSPLPVKTPTCPSGLSVCPIGDDGFECVDLQSELGSCGQCGHDCEETAGIVPAGGVRCSAGRCRATACQNGFWLDRDQCRPV